VLYNGLFFKNFAIKPYRLKGGVAALSGDRGGRSKYSRVLACGPGGRLVS